MFDDGLLVRGSNESVEQLAAALAAGPGRARPSRAQATDVVGLLGAVGGIAGTSGTYFKLSADSMEALKAANGGKVPTGWLSAVLRRDGGDILKHLDIKKVKINPEQALALQTAAIAMALRSAIADVLEAVERVEGKVDDVARLVRAERLGHVLGDRRSLSSLVERVQRSGSISDTDWSSVAAMGPATVRDIEALRAHIRSSIDAEVKASTGSRLDAAETLLDDARVRDSLEMLLVAEENHHLWQLLRLAQVRRHEPHQFAATLEHARESIAIDTAADQAIVNLLRSVLGRLAEPSGTEGWALLSRGRLRDKVGELTDTLQWFTDQRLLELETVPATNWPGFKDSTRHVARTAVAGAGALAGAARDATRRRPVGPADATDTAQLPPSGTAPAELGQSDD
ncbi:hypothetical protein BH10ACT3_BH10ACT3_05050 [soil metagenome]